MFIPKENKNLKNEEILSKLQKKLKFLSQKRALFPLLFKRTNTSINPENKDKTSLTTL